jgi:hypothetical protein
MITIAVVEALLPVETIDIVFVSGRIATSMVLLLSAILALRLVSIYKGGMLRKPWLLLLAGIVVFALAQLMSASSTILGSDLIRTVTAVISLVGSLAIFGGLLRLVNAWRNLAS